MFPFRIVAALPLWVACAHARHPTVDPDLRIANCRAALSASVGAPPEQIAEIYATGCADLYAAQGCAAAWRSWPTVPIEARVATVALACRDASCPSLPAPRPALCDTPGPGPLDIRSGWPALNRAILAHDLAMNPNDVDTFQAELAMMLVTAPTLARPSAAAAAVNARPDLVLDDSSLIIPFDGGFTMLNAPLDLALLRERLATPLLGCASRTIVVAVPPEVNPDLLSPVLTALQDAGCQKVRMDIQQQQP